jgi:hypothetical protein
MDFFEKRQRRSRKTRMAENNARAKKNIRSVKMHSVVQRRNQMETSENRGGPRKEMDPAGAKIKQKLKAELAQRGEEK